MAIRIIAGKQWNHPIIQTLLTSAPEHFSAEKINLLLFRLISVIEILSKSILLLKEIAFPKLFIFQKDSSFKLTCNTYHNHLIYNVYQNNLNDIPQAHNSTY